MIGNAAGRGAGVIRRWTAAVALWAVAALQARAEPPQKLYVTNSAGDDVHVIDTATNRVIRRLEVGPEPHGIAAPAAQDVIFVSLENMKGAAGELLWLDPATDTVTKRIPIGPRPNQLACTPDGTIVYVPCDDGLWWVIDGKKGDVITKVRTGGRPHNTLCSVDGKRMYLAPMGDPHKVTICDTATHAVVGEIPFSNVVRPVAMTRDEKRFYAEVDGLVGFEVADIAARKMTRRVEAAVPADVPKVESRSHGLGLSPDEKELWMCDVHHARTYVFDLTAEPPKQTAAIVMDGAVYWLCFTPDGKTCYVSERETNQVAVVDTATKRVLAHIPVGKVPKRVLVVTAPVEFTFSNFQKPKDSGRARIEDGKAIITLSSSDGIGGVTVTTKKGLWPRDVTVLIEGIGNLERFAVTTDRLWAQGSLKQSGWAELSLRNAKGEFEKYDPTGPFIRAGSLDVRVEKRKEGMAIVFPANLFADTGSVSIGWIDAWRR